MRSQKLFLGLSVILLFVQAGLASWSPAPPNVSERETSSWADVVRELSSTTSAEVQLAALADDDDDEDEGVDLKEVKGLSGDDLTLEKIFPDKSIFGPSASNIKFSRDGRYAAYLYRPRVERRHGNDLWLYDTTTGESTRITMATVFAEYQESARKVVEDRTKKAKKAGKGKGKGAKNESKESNTTKGDGKDDGVSGTWEGELIGSGEDEIPPGASKFSLELHRNEDGSLRGSLSTAMSQGEVTEGTWDAETGALELTLKDEGSNLTATLTAKVSGDSMSGSLRVDAMDMTVRIEATRTEFESVTKSDDDDEEDTDEDSGDDDEGGGEDGVDGDDEDGDDDDGDDEDTQKLGDRVDDKDADDRRSPRYRGVSTYTWSPVAQEMIITSEGDLYRYTLEDGSMQRLTRTREGERDVQYLPDGSGYTYMRGDALIKVSFGDHIMEQIDPQLDSGFSMVGYRVSPDGNRVVVLARSGGSFFGGGRTVNIVSYRERFAQVRQVPRHMSDDPRPKTKSNIYLFDLGDHMTEDAQLKKIFSHEQTGPRDILQVPEWAPDSSRVSFSVFSQDSGHVEILESRFVPKEDEDDDDDNGDDNGNDDGDDGDDGDDEGDDEGDEDGGPEFEIEDARPVYKFLHNGGPNTPGMIHPYYMADSRRMVFLTELSGFRHLHVLDPAYEQLDQLTSGRFEVYPFRLSHDHSKLFVTATKDDPTQEQVFAVELETGELRKLSNQSGVYNTVAVNDAATHVLTNHVDYGSLRELTVINVEESLESKLTQSHDENAWTLTAPMPEYFVYQNRHGQDIHGHMFKPDDWTPDDKRPLLIYVYGGPLGTRKMATRGSFAGASYFFGYYMAKKHGYVTCTIDPRGASGYGGLFEKSNFEQVGKPQVEDLVDGAHWFAENQGVDADRIGMHGWSFGGFQTQMCLYTEPDVFACGIAGAGPTEWENYNSWYSTGTIGDSRIGETDLKAFSLLPLAKNLKAELLLIHGMEDSNVLYQDTVRVYRELLKAGKETLVELFLDPTGGHGLGGDVKTIGRYRKYESFLLRTIGDGFDDEDHDDQDEDEDDDENDDENDDDDDDESAASS